jgi:hypothetical protein
MENNNMKKSDIKKLDKLWSLKVKEKAGYKCEVCLEEGGWLNSCHIIGRRYRSTRWGAEIQGVFDLCGFCACFGCHRKYDEHSPHESFIRRVVIGTDRYQKISEKAKQNITKNQDYETIKKYLEDKC